MKEKIIAKTALDFFYIIKSMDEKGLISIANAVEAQSIESRNEMKKIIRLAK